MSDNYPMADDLDWPEAWLMAEKEITDQSVPNRCTPNIPITPAQMRELGICYWNMPDVDKYQVGGPCMLCWLRLILLLFLL